MSVTVRIPQLADARWSSAGGQSVGNRPFLLAFLLLISVPIASAAMLTLSLAGTGAPQAITPTNEWVNFYSSRSYLHGQLAPVGAVVRAYNPRGVLAGEFTVTQVGWYGVMPVYRDDPNTPQDEGLLPGEEVRFTIDDIAAHSMGPDSPIWTTNGALLQVDLVANTITPTNEWVGFYSFSSAVDGLPLAAGSVVRGYNPRGVLAGEYIVEHVGWYGVMAVYRDDPNTPADEGLRSGEVVSFTVNGWPATPVGPDPATWTANGALLQVDLAQISPDPTLVARKSDNDVILTWLSLGGNADHYEVYRSTQPYFTPDSPDAEWRADRPAPPLGGELSYQDDDVLGEPGVSYFYLVRAAMGDHHYSASNHVGAFNFALRPGTQ